MKCVQKKTKKFKFDEMCTKKDEENSSTQNRPTELAPGTSKISNLNE